MSRPRPLRTWLVRSALSLAALLYLSVSSGAEFNESAGADRGLATGVPAAPVIAIIIDDLGYRAEDAERIVALPAPVAMSILPGTPFARQVALTGTEHGREVMLHQPMAAIDPARDPGPRALLPGMTVAEVTGVLSGNLDALPGVTGVNGHMGSLLTTHSDVMRELMRILSTRETLFFVDSYTNPGSVALRQAWVHGLPATRRDVFLDHEPDETAVKAQVERLRLLARERGSALAIGHPGTAALSVLDEVIPVLREEGFRLVSVRELIEHQRHHPSGDENRPPYDVLTLRTGRSGG
jgi:polysaccharide deacetylase 2 family uncharacterized protein YibQ